MIDLQQYSKKVFIDSNIVLEALPLQKLPWGEIESDGPILVLLLPTLLREVDSKKKDGRLAARAREFNRLVAPLAAEGKPITIISSPNRVDMMISTCTRIKWEDYDDLDPSQGDDRIVAEILNAREVHKGEAILISQDINPLFAARRHGIDTVHVSENWFPLPSPSPADKEISRLRQQLKEYEKTEPKMEVQLDLPPMPINIFQVQPLTTEEADTLRSAIIKRNPIPKQRQDVFGSIQYDHSLDGRYAKYLSKTVPAFIEHYHRKLERLFGQIPFTLSVSNNGLVRADHLKIDIQIIGGWFNSKPIFVGGFPSAPRVKDSFSFPLDLHASMINSRFRVGRHEMDVDDPKEAEKFSVQCEDFRQNQKWNYSGVVWLDPYFQGDHAVIIRITAANLHGEATHPFTIQKICTTTHSKDLSDLSSGMIKRDYFIRPIVTELIQLEKFDSLDYDKDS